MYTPTDQSPVNLVLGGIDEIGNKIGGSWWNGSAYLFQA